MKNLKSGFCLILFVLGAGCGRESDSSLGTQRSSDVPAVNQLKVFQVTEATKAALLQLNGSPQNDCLLRLSKILTDSVLLSGSKDLAKVLDQNFFISIQETCMIQEKTK